jgi:hypothetical protein
MFTEFSRQDKESVKVVTTSRQMKVDLLFVCVGLAFLGLAVCQDVDRTLDRFNYDTTKRYDGHVDFGPAEWDKVQCEDLSKCVSVLDLQPIQLIVFSRRAGPTHGSMQMVGRLKKIIAVGALTIAAICTIKARLT